MVTQIYDFHGNFKELDNFKMLTPLYDRNGELKIFKPKTKKQIFKTIVLCSVIGICILEKGIPVLAVGELTQTTQQSTYGLKEGLWDTLGPLVNEFITGSNVLAIIALAYCGVLFLMGQTSKAKKVFWMAIEGYVIIRLAPNIIGFVDSILQRFAHH